MKKFTGKVISTKMKDAVTVEITFLRQHPLYKKIVSRRKRLKAQLLGMTVSKGDTVVIGEVRPVSRDIHFKVVEIKKV